jgi:hypothetical protein
VGRSLKVLKGCRGFKRGENMKQTTIIGLVIGIFVVVIASILMYKYDPVGFGARIGYLVFVAIMVFGGLYIGTSHKKKNN